MTATLRQGKKLLSDSSFPFVASTLQQAEFGLPDQFFKRLWCRLRGTFLPNTVTVPGTAHADGALRLVPLITVKVDGKIKKQGSLGSFARAAELYDQATCVRSDIYSGAAIAQPFDLIVPISFEAMGGVSPADSVLDGRVSRKIQVEVTWATAADLVVGETSTPAFSVTPQLDLYYEATDAFDVSAPLWEYRETEQPFQNIVTAEAADFPLTYEQGVVVRALQIRAEDSGDMSDAMIQKVSLLINGTKEVPLQDLTAEFLEGFTGFNFGVSRTAKGYIHIELCERNNDGSLILTTGLGALGNGGGVNSLALRMKTTAPVGVGAITIHKHEMVPQHLQAA